MSTANKPDSLRLDERLVEIAEIMAAGLMRAVGRKSSQVCDRTGESSLDCTAYQSGDPVHNKAEKPE